jgi:hypothetical protein
MGTEGGFGNGHGLGPVEEALLPYNDLDAGAGDDLVEAFVDVLREAGADNALNDGDLAAIGECLFRKRSPRACIL